MEMLIDNNKENWSLEVHVHF